MRVLHSLWVVAIGMLLAQQVPQVLTLERAVDLASEQSERIRAAEAGIRQAEGERIRARSELFPQLTGSAGYHRTLATEFGDVFQGPLIGDGVIGDGVVEEIDLPFGRRNIWRVDLNLLQNIYSGGRIGSQINLARASRNIASANLQTTRGQVELEVAQAFFDAAVADRFVAIAEATVRQAEETIRQIEAGFRLGTQPEFELLRATVDRDNQIPILNRARVDREISYLRLKQLIEIPAGETIHLDVDLQTDRLEIPALYATRFSEMEARLANSGTPPLERSAVRAAAALVEREQANVESVEAERRPNIFALSNYSNITYPSGLFTGFGDIRTNWTLGASIVVPILTGRRQRGNEIIARAQLDAQRAQFELTEETADVDARAAWAEFVAAQSTWQASTGSVGLARRAYGIAEVRFRSGVSTQLELSDTRLQLEVTEANHAQAARNLQVARIRIALLPDLPIGTTPSLVIERPTVTPASDRPILRRPLLQEQFR